MENESKFRSPSPVSLHLAVLSDSWGGYVLINLLPRNVVINIREITWPQ